MHRTIVLVDVERFGDRRRTNPHQVAVRTGLYRVLREAFDRSRIPWADCDHEDRGDGVFVLALPQVPKCRFVDTLPFELVEVLRQHNDLHPAQERIRLRVAVHAGEVIYDEHGATGASINLAFRLLEVAPLKAALAASPGLVALIVSSWMFDEVVRHSTVTDPGRYSPVHVRVKETTARGWIHLPDYPSAHPAPVDQFVDPSEPVPRQLPLAVRDFVGRDDQLDALDALLPAEPGASPGAVVIAALDGTAGVGKTTLAVHWAHRVQHRFPDGTLFVNLRGYGPSAPLAPSLALTSLLHGLGVPDGRIPAELDTQVGMYRSLLAGRRVLLVFDNAATPEQVRPLLPGAAGCMVLVTSRADMTGLVVAESAHRIPVDLFTEGEADTLIRGVIGVGVAAAEPAAVTALIAACARLPLALRVAAARIAARPTSIAEVVDGLTGAQDRLTAWSGSGDAHSAVRTVFDWSYSRLPTDHARTFRRLGLHVSPELGVYAAAALTGLDPTIACRHLEALADMHLVTPMGGKRYRMHDLLYAYAAYRAEVDEAPDIRRHAVTDLLTWYARTAQTADRLLFPGLGCVYVELDSTGGEIPLANRSQALAWMNAEQANLMAALQAAVHQQTHQAAIALAGTARFLALREPALWIVRFEAESLGLAAARASGNLAMEAFLLGFRGDTLTDLGQLAEAQADFERTFVLGRQLKDPLRQRVAFVGLGQIRLRQNRYLEARRCFQEALALARSTGDRRAEAVVHCNLSRISVQLGQFTPALEHAEQELLLRRQTKDRVGEAYALHDVATAWQGLGRHDTAIDLADQAIALYRHLDGTDQYTASALETLATSLERTGDLHRATRCLTEAATILAERDDPHANLLRDRIHRLESRTVASAPE